MKTGGLDDLMESIKGKASPQGNEATRGQATPPKEDNSIKKNQASTLPLIADSVYHFKHIEETTIYLLDSFEGECIPGFPSTYKIGKYKGRQYIRFRKTAAPNLRSKFPYTLELENARMFTGLKMEQGKDGKFRGFGDDRNLGCHHCIFVEMSKDCKDMAIAFINGKADISGVLFREWIAELRKRGL